MGEQDDLARTLESHRKYLQRYALFHLREDSLAEDAVQETLLAALAPRDRFKGRSQLHAPDRFPAPRFAQAPRSAGRGGDRIA
ncbi:MAG: sigma factor [Burkholderiales bacterium]|jgi:DNA-directed RNA polymerase specialized sigma24 family protein